MQVKCEYCDSFIEANLDKCPYCGATNLNMARNTTGTPKTIEQLKSWYTARNLPPEEKTRFFIGKDYKGARAFGIYQDGQDFIVYKNKDNGTRAIRYKGTDEAYAVNEIYLKLKSEILNQKAHNASKKNFGSKSKNKQKSTSDRKGLFSGFEIDLSSKGLWTVIIIAVSILITLFSDPYRGGKYYRFPDTDAIYYNLDDDWYYYDDYRQDYVETTVPPDYYSNLNDYRFDDSENWDSSIIRFEDSFAGEEVEKEYLESFSSSNSSDSDNDSSWDWSSDSDYDWDSGSDWDSGDSDWDSDW